jgi:hypothetical protein
MSTRDYVGITLASAVMGWVVASCVPAGLPMVEHVPLLGAHATLGCSDCHIDSLEAPLPNTCSGCHSGDAPPDHYEGDCATCHNNEDWRQVDVDHDFFPLLGGHDQPECTTCHLADTFKGLDSSCMSCHEPDRPVAHYEGQDCVSCHNIFDWEDANIDHSFFPLEFSHAEPTCTECHLTNDYADADPACISCHAADEPRNHFGDDCASCHNIRDWEDADFNHNRFFPIPHEGVRECSSCHPNEQDYAQFTCTDCHAHRQGNMNGEHRGISGYRYDSYACLDCHPRGQE